MCPSIFLSFLKKASVLWVSGKGSGLSHILHFLLFCLLRSRVKGEQSHFMLTDVLIHAKWWWCLGWVRSSRLSVSFKVWQTSHPNTVVSSIKSVVYIISPSSMKDFICKVFHRLQKEHALFSAKLDTKASNISYSKAINLYDNHSSEPPNSSNSTSTGFLAFCVFQFKIIPFRLTYIHYYI